MLEEGEVIGCGLAGRWLAERWRNAGWSWDVGFEVGGGFEVVGGLEVGVGLEVGGGLDVCVGCVDE